MPVTFINALNVDANDDAFFVEMWDEGANYVATQPGFVATSLHKSHFSGAAFQYFTVAVWESNAHFRAATSTDWWIAYRKRFGFDGDSPRFKATPSLCAIVRDKQGLFN
jgi:heme-degrading monooxygenase HmoA